MTNEKYRQAIVIEADARNHVESVINDLKKQIDKGKVEFGLNIEMRRVEIDKADVEGFGNE